MKGDKLIYFFNCYFLMLDYDETLDEIVKGYIEKESAENTKLLIEDLKYIVVEGNNTDEYLEDILNSCDEMNVYIGELRIIVNEVYSRFIKFNK